MPALWVLYIKAPLFFSVLSLSPHHKKNTALTVPQNPHTPYQNTNIITQNFSNPPKNKHIVAQNPLPPTQKPSPNNNSPLFLPIFHTFLAQNQTLLSFFCKILSFFTSKIKKSKKNSYLCKRLFIILTFNPPKNIHYEQSSRKQTNNVYRNPILLS